MKTSPFYLPSPGGRAEIEAMLAGMRSELYQRMLHEISARKQLADGCRLRQVSFTEHLPIADPPRLQHSVRLMRFACHLAAVRHRRLRCASR